MLAAINAADRKESFSKYIETYSHTDSQEEWLAKVKGPSESSGYAVDVKEYKKSWVC